MCIRDRTQIVHDDRIARLQLGDEKLLDIGQKHFAIDGTVNDAGRDHAALPQSSDERRDLPVAMRHCIDQPLATDCAPIAPDHVRRGPSLIEKDELASTQLGLVLAPRLTRSGDIRARLLGGMDGLFLCVRRNCAKVLDISPWLALVMCSSCLLYTS